MQIIEWLKLKRLTMPCASKNSEETELSFIGMKNGTAILENSLGSFEKNETHASHVTPPSTPGYTPKRNESVRAQKSLLPKVHSSCIHDGCNREQPKCPPAGKWVMRLAYPRNEIPLSSKKGMRYYCSRMDESK